MADVAVITGVGGMGEAIARRLGRTVPILLGDVSATALANAASALAAEQIDITTAVLDVADPGSVDAFAGAAAALGRVVAVVHTAGVSPARASTRAVLDVDLLGTALLVDAFEGVIAEGGAMVCVASMAGSIATLDPELERALATTETAELLSLPQLTRPDMDPAEAYVIAKRGNQLRVTAAAGRFGRRGARIVSLSPGIIDTAMGRDELASPVGAVVRGMIEQSPLGRLGRPEEIADVVAFLVGPHATYITGTDLLVDGGVVAAMRLG